MQKEEKQILTLKFKWQVLYMYFHQIEGVEFIHDSHGQTFHPVRLAKITL